MRESGSGPRSRNTIPLVLEIVTTDRNAEYILMVACHFPKNVTGIYEFSLVVEAVLFNPTHVVGLYVFQTG